MKTDTPVPNNEDVKISPRGLWGRWEIQRWYRPTLSPQKGVYIILLIAYFTGVAASDSWNGATVLALICAFLGFQAEYPISQQIKQRKTLKLRFLIWGGLYGAVAVAIALYLYIQTPILGWLYAGVVVALVADSFAIFFRQQQSVWNEAIAFAAIAIASPLAYIATTHHFAIAVLGLWLLNTLFFCSSIFTVKLRKPKTASLIPASVYHAIASLAAIALWYCSWLSPLMALAFGIGLLKFSFIVFWQDWYRTTKIQNVAILETTFAALFLLVVVMSPPIAFN